MIESLDTEYVMFIDQDDRFCREDAFGHSLELIKSQNYDFVNFTCEREINENGTTFDKKPSMYGDFSYCGDKLFEKFYPCDNHFIFHSKIFRSDIVKRSIPYELVGKRFSSGDMFCSAMWWFNSKRYLNVATDDPIYEYKNYTGVWGSNKKNFSAKRIGELCICSYNVMVSLYNRMVRIRPINTVELNNLVRGVNLPIICRLIKSVRKVNGDEQADGLMRIFHSAFCADGVHLLNGIDKFEMPEYISYLEGMMK